ncbi:hypothetical protein L1987_86280 [Smallanthus sonchifolius]|uniref:Uncharacterized protein n=1 Tax=Smallanthus sonchifolius TaxID=185202 RepID=A0ACB8XZQ4_9ASTR|nr:hypothetical protein L1987_86280 [Smallanthus sonchifolius]
MALHTKEPSASCFIIRLLCQSGCLCVGLVNVTCGLSFTLPRYFVSLETTSLSRAIKALQNRLCICLASGMGTEFWLTCRTIAWANGWDIDMLGCL